MKRISIIIFFALCLLSCKKEGSDTPAAEFPEKGACGTNLLALKDSSQLEGYVIYSLAAKTGKGAALKVRLIQMSDDDRGTWEVTGSADGWTIEPFNKNTKTQLFIANKDGAIDVPLMFTFKKGAVSIEITKSGVNSEKWFSWVTN